MRKIEKYLKKNLEIKKKSVSLQPISEMTTVDGVSGKAKFIDKFERD